MKPYFFICLALSGCGWKVSETRTPYEGVDAQFCQQFERTLTPQNYPLSFTEKCRHSPSFQEWLFTSIKHKGWHTAQTPLDCGTAFTILVQQKNGNKAFLDDFADEAPCFSSYISYQFH